ncbi:MAG: tRNA pseudouridine(55) synthase TruB [Gammaproteobacteria bacterium]|nr:tRNA pseudouridine(55) synthase TruB [Gammaproteobacteria bacterium]
MSEPSAHRPRRALDGLLLLDKPTGITSNGALQRVKWLFQALKAGHTGSLDPLASGMLPICFGEATKFSGYLLDADKVYRVQAFLGVRTDTGDAAGSPVETHSRAPVSPAELEQAVAVLRGPIHQIPPMYSALKQQGQRLYALARAGLEVPREPRPVHIHEFTVEAYDPLRPVFQVRCSKGTYIRTLIEDLAAGLGTVGHVIALRRLAVEPFSGQPMLTMEALEAAAGTGQSPSLEALDKLLRPLEAALPQCPAVELDAAMALLVSRGGRVLAPPGLAAGLVRLHAPGHRFLGVGEVQPDGVIAPRRLVAQVSPPFRADA